MTDEAILRIRIYCNSCKQETNHELKGEHKSASGDEDFNEELSYSLWICMGCEHGLLRQIYTNSEMYDEYDYQYFPERSQNALVRKTYSKLKPQLAAIYGEAITCYNGKALILCAAGLRALLEGICQNKRVKGKNLKAKINGLEPLLPNKNIIRNLHHFRFMGNDAVHELAAPKSPEVALAIGVIEDLLNFFYELDYKASRLRELRQNKKQKKSVRPGTVASAMLGAPPNP